MKIIIITPFVLLILALFASCGGNSESEESVLKVPVKTAAVVQTNLSFPIHASGVLAAGKEMRLSFKTGGIVKEILVNEGESVNAGQLLAQLDLAEIQAQVKQARSAYEKAQRDHLRAENLYADTVITLEQFQNAETALDVAKANLEIAEFNLRRSKITAPADGKILRRFVEVNELVAPGTPVLYFGATDNDWRVKAGISERDVVHLQLGDSAQVRFDAYPEKTFWGRVTEISGSAHPASGTYEVEVRLKPTPQARLVSGFVAKVDLYPSKTRQYYLIPVEALVEADGRTGYVFTPTDEGVKKIPIEIGNAAEIFYEEQVVVRSGLENISRVITQGAQYLTEQSILEIVDEATQTGN